MLVPGMLQGMLDQVDTLLETFTRFTGLARLGGKFTMLVHGQVSGIAVCLGWVTAGDQHGRGHLVPSWYVISGCWVWKGCFGLVTAGHKA